MSDNYNDLGSSNEEIEISENYNQDQIDSYVYTAENSKKIRKKKKHKSLKAISLILCIAILGTGVGFGYKIYKDNENKNELPEFNADKPSINTHLENEDNSIENNLPDTPSLIQLASRSDAKAIPDIIDDIMPSVVGVSATFEYETYGGYYGFGGQQTQKQQVQGTGTGIVITEDGYIVTNAHCVFDDSSGYDSGVAVEVSVLFSDKSEREAKIIAYDTETDIAVLKVDQSNLTPATFGDSNELRVGELVIAVGNPLGFELFGTVTCGIVSALNREISINEKNMTLIQTDAAINSGNSGGPLLNSCGQVIGINSAKMSSSYGSASVEGLGFAIPMNEAKLIIDDLINYKHVTGRPQIGITTIDVNETVSSYLNIPMGVYIRNVEENSAAENAGLQIGDVIIAIEGEAITSAEELNRIKNEFKAGDNISLTINRMGRDIEVSVTLQEAGMVSTEE